MREIVADIDSQRQQNSNSPSKQGTKIGKNCRKIHSNINVFLHNSKKSGFMINFYVLQNFLQIVIKLYHFFWYFSTPCSHLPSHMHFLRSTEKNTLLLLCFPNVSRVSRVTMGQWYEKMFSIFDMELLYVESVKLLKFIFTFLTLGAYCAGSSKHNGRMKKQSK